MAKVVINGKPVQESVGDHILFLYKREKPEPYYTMVLNEWLTKKGISHLGNIKYSFDRKKPIQENMYF